MRTIHLLFLIPFILSCGSENPKKAECYVFNGIKPSIEICGDPRWDVKGKDSGLFIGPNKNGWFLSLSGDSMLYQLAPKMEMDEKIEELLSDIDKETGWKIPEFKEIYANQQIIIKNGKIDSANSYALSIEQENQEDSVLFTFHPIGPGDEKYIGIAFRTDLNDKAWLSSKFRHAPSWLKLPKKMIKDSLIGYFGIQYLTYIESDSIIATIDHRTIKIIYEVKP